MNNRYKKSQEFLVRSEKTIPLGTQTFSKSKTQYPFGVSPYYINNGKGSKVWDIDGNEYIDYVNSLASVTLGYCDEDINQAILEQLSKGIIFSLPSQIETELAEKLCEIIPCAQMVRFGKNGSDATAGAIRASRAYNKKDHIAVCGYHGWQDWYIGSTQRNLGVPKASQDLTHSFKFNDIESLNSVFKKFPDQISCVIMEAMNLYEPQDNFLHKVQELCKKNNALFILDETITGFRFNLSGAQKEFDIVPDMATFGKGMSNGMPLSAVVGKAEIMKIFEEVFFSFTFGGETLSIVSALACIKKYEKMNVCNFLNFQGAKIIKGVKKIINKIDAHDLFEIAGHPSWSFLIIKDFNNYSSYKIKTLFLQEVFKNGIITLGTHNMSFSHSDNDVKKLLDVYEVLLPMIFEAAKSNLIDNLLDCEPLQPLFKVR